jgi:hypothetical protein
MPRVFTTGWLTGPCRVTVPGRRTASRCLAKPHFGTSRQPAGPWPHSRVAVGPALVQNLRQAGTRPSQLSTFAPLRPDESASAGFYSYSYSIAGLALVTWLVVLGICMFRAAPPEPSGMA